MPEAIVSVRVDSHGLLRIYLDPETLEKTIEIVDKGITQNKPRLEHNPFSILRK